MVTEIGSLKRWHNTKWPCSPQASCSLVVIIVSFQSANGNKLQCHLQSDFFCPMLLTINIPAIQRWYCMFTELHFKHNTVCQFTTDEELLESPFENNGDTNVLTFSQGKCNSQIRNVYIATIRFFFFSFIPHPEFPAKWDLAKCGL